MLNIDREEINVTNEEDMFDEIIKQISNLLKLNKKGVVIYLSRSSQIPILENKLEMIEKIKKDDILIINRWNMIYEIAKKPHKIYLLTRQNVEGLCLSEYADSMIIIGSYGKFNEQIEGRITRINQKSNNINIKYIKI